MSCINKKIVRRSWSIWTGRGQGYGNQFTYKKSMSFDFLTALVMTSIFCTLDLLIKAPFLCGRVKKMLQNQEPKACTTWSLLIHIRAKKIPTSNPSVLKGFSKVHTIILDITQESDLKMARFPRSWIR